jgi:hypothetical protein
VSVENLAVKPASIAEREQFDGRDGFHFFGIWVVGGNGLGEQRPGERLAIVDGEPSLT